MSIAREHDDVERAQERDSEAFRRLYMATADRVQRLARWLMNTADVDDVVQDVYVRAWEELPALREPRAFDGWLRQIAVTVILRCRERSARSISREHSLRSAASVITQTTSPGLRVDLERAVARLPEGARDVFVMYDVEGHQHREIAALLGISHHTSRSQLHRARALLKSFLEEAE